MVECRDSWRLSLCRDQLSVLKKSLAAARTESAELLREISERRCLLESLTAESNVVERELNVLRAKHAEGRQLLDKLEVILVYTLSLFVGSLAFLCTFLAINGAKVLMLDINFVLLACVSSRIVYHDFLYPRFPMIANDCVSVCMFLQLHCMFFCMSLK